MFPAKHSSVFSTILILGYENSAKAECLRKATLLLKEVVLNYISTKMI